MTSAGRGRGLHLAFFAAGALATAAQVLLLRELIVALAGDEAALGVGLAAWLAGIAAGAWLARRIVPTRASLAAAMGLSLLAVLAPAGVVVGRLLRQALAPPAGELPSLGLALALASLVLAPAGGLVGWTFTMLAAVASRAWSAGEGIARLYVTESLGSLAGGVATTVFVVAYLSTLRGALLAGGLAVVLTLPAVRAGWLAGRRGLPVLLAALLAVLAASEPLDRWSQRARFAGIAPGTALRTWTETPYQHLAIGGDGVRHLYASGQYAGSFPDPYGSETLAHILATLAPRPARVLALAGVERGLLRFLLQHPVERLVLVEPDTRALAFLRTQLPFEDRQALAEPRVRVVHDDARRFLARSAEAFDLVLLLGPDPVTLLRARLTTAESYRLCAQRLAPDGVLVASVKTAPNVLTGETAALAGSLYRALGDVFPVVRVTPGPETLLVAGRSAGAATLDPAVLSARWRARGIVSSSFAPEVIPLLLSPERVAAQEAALREAAQQVAASRDDRPVSFLYALARRQRETGSRIGRAFAALGDLPTGALVASVLAPSVVRLLLLAGRKRAAAAAQHAVAVTGAAGMAWSLLILFAFQTRAGVLYGQLGLLTALFMLGLAVGGFAAMRRRLGVRTATAFAATYAVLFALVLPGLGGFVAKGETVTLAAHGGLLLIAGLVTGGVFPAASRTLIASGQGAAEAAGRLEAADHVGASLAALLGAVVFIPVLGTARAAWLVAGLVGLALATLAVARKA